MRKEGTVTVWVNVDKPTRKYTIHESPSCQFVSGAKETPHKGVHQLKPDGGWLQFESYDEAITMQQREFPSYSVSHCCLDQKPGQMQG